MGYFANGTMGDLYEQEYCSRCVHQGGCSVWDLHFAWNYDAAKNKKTVLDLFIPRDKDGFNEQCTMFHEGKPEPTVEDWTAKLHTWQNELPTPTETGQ